MNGPHDLGGSAGHGPVLHDADGEPVFAEPWERAALLMFPAGARAGLFQLDQFRRGMELMPTEEYLQTSYYEHWVHTVAYHARRGGILDDAEWDKRTQYYLENPNAPLPDTKNPELMEFLETVLITGASTRVESDKAAQFKVGDRVVVSKDPANGHTRRAGYIHGKSGVITIAHGTFVYPDTIANDEPETAEHVYAVQFTASELWGEEAGGPKDTNCIDVWEPYIALDPAPTSREHDYA